MWQEKVTAAHDAISQYISETPLEYSVSLSAASKSSVYLKCENMQYTGSFKVRGALNKIVSLPVSEREKGIIAASTGNHGMATCYAAQKLGPLPVTIYVPNNAKEVKLQAMQAMGGTVVKVDSNNCIDSEIAARKASAESKLEFISPYNDEIVVAGQGTIGYEIFSQLQQIGGKKPDAIFVSVGGGGLIGGIAGFIKEVLPECQIIGCQPENSKVMLESIKAGCILQDVPEFPTLSDGTAGGIEENSITFEIVQHCVDKFVTVSEEEIGESLLWALEKEHMMVEGAAAVVIAAFLKIQATLEGKNAVLVLCGRNISATTLIDLANKK